MSKNDDKNSEQKKNIRIDNIEITESKPLDILIQDLRNLIYQHHV